MAAPTPTGNCVLLVDDNPELITLYIDAIPRISPFRVITAEDGAIGLERFYTTDPQPVCVVIDVRMPEMDGYQLVRALRGDPSSANTPLVILTAMAQERERFIGLASGADQYLTKPVTPTELVAAIQRALTLSAEERQRRLQELAETEEDPS